MNTKTIHEQAARLLGVYRYRLDEWRETHPHTPRWIADRIVESSRLALLRKCAREAVRPRVWPVDADTVARGQERRHELGAIARGLRRVTGLSGAALRRLAEAVRNSRYCWSVDYVCVDAVPDTALGGAVGDIRRSGVYTEQRDGWAPASWTASWAAGHWGPDQGVRAIVLMALVEAVRLDVGELYARAILAGSGPISGYLAAELAGWRAGYADRAGSYETCAGGEPYQWLRAHPEHWAALLARCPRGQATATAVQCYPHETARARACAAAGLMHTLRLSDSVYTGTPEQVAAALAD